VAIAVFVLRAPEPQAMPTHAEGEPEPAFSEAG
jgi:hypothetical protein